MTAQPSPAGSVLLTDSAVAVVPTGVPWLDELAVGFGPGELWVVSGYPLSVTLLLRAFASYAAGVGAAVTICSAERDSDAWWRALLSGWAGLAPRDLRDCNWTAETHGCARVSWARQIGSQLDLTVLGAERLAERWPVGRARIVVLDGLSDVDRVAGAARAVRDRARAEYVTVVAGIYDTDDLREWRRHADTAIRIDRPDDRSESPTQGEIALKVSSRKWLLLRAQAQFEFTVLHWTLLKSFGQPSLADHPLSVAQRESWIAALDDERSLASRLGARRGPTAPTSAAR